MNLDNVRELALERFAGRPDSWRVCAYFGHGEEADAYAVVAGMLGEREASCLMDRLADDLAHGRPYLDVRAMPPRAKEVANGHR